MSQPKKTAPPSGKRVMYHYHLGVATLIKPHYSRPDVSPEMVEIMCLFFYREQNGLDMPPYLR